MMLVAVHLVCFILLIKLHSASIGDRDFLKTFSKKGQVNEGEMEFRYNLSVSDEKEVWKWEDYLKSSHNNQHEHFPNRIYFSHTGLKESQWSQCQLERELTIPLTSFMDYTIIKKTKSVEKCEAAFLH